MKPGPFHCLGACALAVLLAGASPPPAPPAVGVSIRNAGRARLVDAVLPGHLLATALPRGADGRRRLLALTTPDDPKAEQTPAGPRSLYLIDPERAGAPRRLLHPLPEKSNALAAADLDGDGAEEILLGEPGKLWSLGSPDAPAAPRLLLEAPGFDLREQADETPRWFQAAEIGRLRTWAIANGSLAPEPERPLPILAAQERWALRLSSSPVTVLARPGNAPLLAVGPEENEGSRLRTILIGSGREQTEAWTQLPGGEKVDSFHYLSLDGRPVLVVVASNREDVKLFEKRFLRLYPLDENRSRVGQPPALVLEMDSESWLPVEPVVADLDRDGRQDLAVLQSRNFKDGDLVIDTFFGQGDGRFERPRRMKLAGFNVRSWSFGEDVTGDGAADLVTLGETGLCIFAGTSDVRRNLLDRDPRHRVYLGGAHVEIDFYGESDPGPSASNEGPRIADLDGDGRREILLSSANELGRGRVTLVRPGP